MKFDWLTTPIEEAAPCGPDLADTDDDAFLDYYYEAEARLPERYFTPGQASAGSQDRLFDPRSVDLSRETDQITKLLRRSRDLRLLSLLARWSILAHRLDHFADAVEQMGELMELWQIELHPQSNRSAADRRAAIEELNAQPSVVMPLVHFPVLPSGDVTLRRHMVATGKAEPRASEEGIGNKGSDLLAPLRSDANLKHVSRIQSDLSRIASGIERITVLSNSHPNAPFKPDLVALKAAIADMQGMIAAARPDLPVWSPSEVIEEAQPEPQEGGLDSAPAIIAPPANVPYITDRAHALAALKAAEAWLATQEPSSPALLLVTQARLLIGVPLVQAIRTLMPSVAGQVRIDIGQNSGFSLPMESLESLSKTGLESVTETKAASINPPKLSDRAGLAELLRGVEGYYARSEPASPVPLLLVKAREMLQKRFDAIMAELIATSQPQGKES